MVKAVHRQLYYFTLFYDFCQRFFAAVSKLFKRAKRTAQRAAEVRRASGARRAARRAPGGREAEGVQVVAGSGKDGAPAASTAARVGDIGRIIRYGGGNLAFWG